MIKAQSLQRGKAKMSLAFPLAGRTQEKQIIAESSFETNEPAVSCIRGDSNIGEAKLKHREWEAMLLGGCLE